MSAPRYWWTCCGDEHHGARGSGCDHRDGSAVTDRRWRQLSHGAVGPWRPGWEDRGVMCAPKCDCAERAKEDAR